MLLILFSMLYVFCLEFSNDMAEFLFVVTLVYNVSYLTINIFFC